MTKVHALLVRDHGLRASYDTLWRYATQKLGWRKKTETVRVDDPPPGEQVQVDFGEMGRLLDRETGKLRKLWVLIVTLGFSRYQLENQVPYVRESWFGGEKFVDLEDARRSAEHWCREVAGTRVHGTTRRVPRELFESVEKATMRAPPASPFDVPMWFDRAKVHPDHHIQVAHSLYSVPNRYIRKYVRVRADIAKNKEKGAHIGVYAERLLGGPLPWTKMRQAYALLGLCQKYGEGRVEAICQSALAFDVVSVSRIASMLKSATKPVSPSETQGKVVQLPLPRFARPTGHFETLSRSSKKEGQ